MVDIIKQREKEETSIDHQIHIQLTLKFLFIPYPFKIVTQVEKIREVYFQTHTFLLCLHELIYILYARVKSIKCIFIQLCM